MQNKANRFWVFDTKRPIAIKRETIIWLDKITDDWYIIYHSLTKVDIRISNGNPTFEQTLEWLNYEKE